MRGNRDQRSETRGQRPGLRIVESRECWGCGEPSGEATYCRKCAPEVEAMEIRSLEQLYRASSAARGGAPARKLPRLRRFLREWLWAPNFVFVFGAAVYVGWISMSAIVHFLAGGAR